MATTRYIAQSAGTVTCASGSRTAITPATWNSTSESPGDISYVCGTITGSSGASILVVPSSGSSGNPIQIIFDTGAILQAPYFSTSDQGNDCSSSCGGAIDTNGKSYLIIDGASSGIIQATASGTNLANHLGGQGISIYADNIIVRNLKIQNIYVNVAPVADCSPETTGPPCDVGGENSAGIRVANSANAISICNNTITDARQAILSDFGSSAGTAPNLSCQSNTFVGGLNYFLNTLNRAAWIVGINSGSGGNASVYANDFGTEVNWEYPSSAYHTNGIMIYGQASQKPILYIYDNYFHGDLGSGSPTGQIACLGVPGATASGSQCYAFNNIIVGVGYGQSQDSLAYMGAAATSGEFGTHYFYNNTYVSGGTQNAIVGDSTTPYVYKNNAFQDSNGGYYFANESFNQPFSTGTWDYNAYDPAGSPQWDWGGAATSSFTTWKSNCTSGSGTGCDANGKSCSLNINSSYQPNSGSCLIGAGVNLTSSCSGLLVALCYDAPPTFGAGSGTIEGTARPTGATPWPIGAYQSSNPVVSTPVISPAAGSYPSPQTVSISTATGGATICYTIDSSTPTANGAGGCTHGTTYSGGFSLTIPGTVKAIGSESGFADSSVASNSYILPPPVVTPTPAPNQFVIDPPANLHIVSVDGVPITKLTILGPIKASGPIALLAYRQDQLR